MPPLIAPLRPRLKLAWQMAVTDAYRRTLLAAMDVLDHPAYLLSASAIEHANRAGLALLQTEETTIERIRSAAAGEGGSCFSIEEPGLPALQLITLRPSGRNQQAALDRSVRDWRLSPRQGEVLNHLAGGDTNKEIAAKLGCAEVTIEFHLRGMFSKTGAQNRSELISLF